MAEEQSGELVQELRRIRFILAGIILLLALNYAMEGYLRWAETHHRPAARSQVATPVEKLAAREGNQGE